MAVEIQINNQTAPSARYVTWALAPCRVRFTEPIPGELQQTVTLRNRAGGTGGQVVFYAATDGPRRNQLNVVVPTNGGTASFWIGGRFGYPSTADRDVTIEAVVGGLVVGSVQLMVRIRKNANRLTDAERDAFLDAFGELNGQGLGRFADFRAMHVNGSVLQAHGGPAFLPWHRAYLLDLERELQALRPEVALPYWRFDQPAPRMFTREFIGAVGNSGAVDFHELNPLSNWRTDQTPGVIRRPSFNLANGRPGSVLTQAQTMQLSSQYAPFCRQVEAGQTALALDAHGKAHTSFRFDSYIGQIHTAAKDPLFFLLHANVDRLWALWQRQYSRFNADDTNAFLGSGDLGHGKDDTMWPWNQDMADPRPDFAPGGPLALSSIVPAPGLTPRVRDMLDYQGSLNPANQLGFAYDDVQ